jgi:serine/threonine-protein kinase HipA
MHSKGVVFERIVFNIVIGNTDDHARNHAAFWDGTHLDLTPAYDLCPQPGRVRKPTRPWTSTRRGAGQASSAFA